jgi:hypothetical protein
MLETTDTTRTKVPLAFLNLIGQVDVDASDELADLFARAQQAFRSKKLARTESKLRWLLNRWVRMLRLDANEWRSNLLLRGLFVEEMGWNQLAYLLKMSEARVRSLSLDALLEEVSPDDLMNRPTRDCARNDLYLLDVLTRQVWSDRLGIYPQSHFERHLGECVRCRRVFERTQQYQLGLKSSRLLELPASLQWQVSPPADLVPALTGLSRFPLPARVVGTLGVVVLVFLGVISTPYLGDFLKPKKPAPQTAEAPAPEIAPTPAPTVVAQNPAPTPVLAPEMPESPEAKDLKAALEGATTAAESEEKSGIFARIPDRVMRFIEEKRRSLTSKPAPEATKPFEPSVVAPPIVAKAPEKVPEPPVASPPKATKPAPETKPVVAVAKPQTPVAAPVVSVGTSKIFFRWGARAEDPDRVTQKVLAWLKELGAINAGELEFGALYRGGRYFHFTIPKAAYATLLNNIKTLPLTDFTDAAAEGSRVIAGDQSRIVFWIGPTNR